MDKKVSIASVGVGRKESKLEVTTAVFKAKNLFLKPVFDKRPLKDKLLVINKFAIIATASKPELFLWQKCFICYRVEGKG